MRQAARRREGLDHVEGGAIQPEDERRAKTGTFIEKLTCLEVET
jgi:hypothetical protein